MGYIIFVPSEKIRILSLRLKELLWGKFCGEELKNIYQVTSSGILPLES